jgi:hypothetical protein
MKHVPPHRWADAFAGRIDGAERAALDQHAEECPKCRRERSRVRRASDSFSSIKNLAAPDVSWDAVRAKVHWTVSTERRAKVPPPRPYLPWIAVGAVAVAGFTAALVVPHPAPVVELAAPTRAPDPVPTEPGLVGLVNRTTGEVMIDGIRTKEADLFARRLGAGTKIATATGEVDIQFGAGSAFRLGPHSTLQLRRFDARAIELVVEGRLDLQVAPRAANQRFVVHAGSRAIEVRGTQFRVEHAAGATSVACRHGLVAVTDGGGTVEVAGERRLIVRDRRVTDERAVPLTADELATLADATPTTQPLWDLTALESSAPLEITTHDRRHVRLDGIELGVAPLRIRVMPGRHTVEAADSRGRFRRAGWVDVNAGAAAHLEVMPEPVAPTRASDVRRRQLRAGIDQARVDECTRKLRKQGISGTYVQIEIGVDAQGAINFLNVLDTDMGQASAQCIRDVLRTVTFKPGAAAQWRERIDL